MHRPTRRPRRYKRPPSSIYLSTDISSSSRAVNRLTTTSTDLLEAHAEDSNDVRHRRGTTLDAIRGATLVALVVVTIILYFTLWELERSSFALLPSRNPLVVLSNDTVSNFVSLQLETSIPGVAASLQTSSVEERSTPLNRDATPSKKPYRLTRNAWPPLITRVPDEQNENVNEIDNAHNAEFSSPSATSTTSFDTTYCNGPCHFLLPIRIAEQESKARLHFAQLFALAQKLNRTLVLPNVGKSRMGACSRWPFGAYYDTEALVFTLADSSVSSAGFPPVIDLDVFRNWTEGTPAVPHSYVVSMEASHKGHWRAPGPLETPDSREETPLIVDETGIDPKVLSCLEAKFSRLRSSLPTTALSISLDSRQLKRANVSTPDARLVQLLSGRLGLDTDSKPASGLGPVKPAFDFTNPRYDDLPPFIDSSGPNPDLTPLSNANVLIIDYALRHPLFDKPSVNLHYAPALYDLADRLADNVGPFLGVHWRMENVPVQNLAWCAASLVSVLHGLLEDNVVGENVRNVWLATDYPYVSLAEASGAGFILDKNSDGDGDGDEDDGRREPSLARHGAQKSSTFKVLTPEHDDAIAVLREAFQPGGDLDAWKLSDLLRRYPYVEGRINIDEELLDDSGVRGILDKLVVVRSQVFVGGSKDCSKVSSFSKQVVEARQILFEKDKNGADIRNVIEYFGEW